MANVQITDLPAAGPITGSELVVHRPRWHHCSRNDFGGCWVSKPKSDVHNPEPRAHPAKQQVHWRWIGPDDRR
jgi:hypothetical protein